MSKTNDSTKPLTVQSSDFSTRVTCAANDQMDDYLSADKDMRYMSSTRTRHHALVNATRKYMDTAATIAFYAARYGVTPVSAPAPVYTTADALADIRAAGLPYNMERVITKSAKTRPDVMAAIDAWLDEQAARRARNAAKWAQVSQSLQVVS
jgi:hypothetical protein